MSTCGRQTRPCVSSLRRTSRPTRNPLRSLLADGAARWSTRSPSASARCTAFHTKARRQDRFLRRLYAAKADVFGVMAGGYGGEVVEVRVHELVRISAAANHVPGLGRRGWRLERGEVFEGRFAGGARLVHPFPYVAEHVHRSVGAGAPWMAMDLHHAFWIVDVGGRRSCLVPPRIQAAIGSSRGLLPFLSVRQPLAGPIGELLSLQEAHVHDGILRPFALSCRRHWQALLRAEPGVSFVGDFGLVDIERRQRHGLLVFAE